MAWTAQRSVGVVLLAALVWGGVAGGLGAQEEDYTIGPEDLLLLSVWGHEDLTKTVLVSARGVITLPLIGEVAAAGLSPHQLAARIRDLLAKDYLVNPQVSVTVQEYRSKRVNILGQVAKPGEYVLTKGRTFLLEVVSQAGGVAPRAANYLLIARAKVPMGSAPAEPNHFIRIDLPRLLAAELSDNVLVEPRDTIYIPEVHAFFVLGEVRKSGTFALDKEVTLLDAISLAGGFTEQAAPAAVRILRVTAQGAQETQLVDLSGASGKGKTVRLRDQDTVLVPRAESFFILGEVQKPGAYSLVKRTTVLEAISLAGGFTDKAAPGQAKIVRTRPDGSRATLTIDLSGEVPRDREVLLQENDTLLVPRGNVFFVMGEVKSPGAYQLGKRTTVLEAISLAGGFTEKAAPRDTRLIRRPEEGKEETIVLDLSGAIPRHKDFALRDGDTVIVPAGNAFFVFGEVKKPGAYQLDREVSVLEGVTMAGGLTDKAAPGRTKVIRTHKDGRQETLDVDLNAIVKRGQKEKDVKLQANDLIVVPESFF